MASVLTVAQLNRYLSFKIKDDVKLRGVAVKGELANVKLHYASGHLYFSLKDQDCSVRAVMFSSSASRLKFLPEDGMSVLVIGNISVYERDGSCQIIASELTPLGAGLAHMQTELLKEKLRKQGVFDEERKKPIPLVPKRIAAVTSLTGAALQDMINVISRRYPMTELIVFPATVQGSAAVESVCRALEAADRSGADTLILARGGGSAEDLMPFNDEKTTLAVAGCVTPVISAVGHETDWSLCDLAADMRAPTPSAAAELATPDIADVRRAFDGMSARLGEALETRLGAAEKLLKEYGYRLRANSPERRIENLQGRAALLSERLDRLIDRRLAGESAELDKKMARLDDLSPINVLRRGFAAVETAGGEMISRAEGLRPGDRAVLRFRDGTAEVEIIETDIDAKG
ncbi:MAG: exodeoxyribonuclease VII large subunit [Ruminococcus sp.]|nr:exodeoxyribonuclease VII large subunit [Ruminococcus sp.]